MTEGIRAEISIDSPKECPIAIITDQTGTESYSVSKSIPPDDSTPVTEEFAIDDEVDLDNDQFDETDVIFDYEEKEIVRFSREFGIGCPCEQIEQFDCPIVDVHARDGTLYLTFYSVDMDQLSEALSAIRKGYPSVSVERIVQSDTKHDECDLAQVDRHKLTERQREVLETAHQMGYFDHPKGANAGDVAEELDITTSTFGEHLAVAQQKMLDDLLED